MSIDSRGTKGILEITEKSLHFLSTRCSAMTVRVSVELITSKN